MNIAVILLLLLPVIGFLGSGILIVRDNRASYRRRGAYRKYRHVH